MRRGRAVARASAALGLLLLYGHQSKTGMGLRVDANSPSLRRTMRLQNVDFLLRGLPAPVA